MLNSFLGVETLSRGLYVQQVQQDVLASNMAKTYLDNDGYLMASRQRLDIMEASPLLFGSMAGVKAVGTGPMLQQITRLRSTFLDGQIQTEGMNLGRAEILAELLANIQGVVNGSAGTLDTALQNLSASFTALAANPLNVGLRTDVVDDGVTFATLARNQYRQLQSFQTGLDGRIQRTVEDVNQILKQISMFNNQLLNSQGANPNDLLDARDYALARLSRLINIQVNYGSKGTVDVYLGGSSFSLVDSGGASTLTTNVMNNHNPNLVSVTVQSSHGTVWAKDAAASIHGGRLAGMLEARDVLLESYKTQVDQIATSVLHMVNNFHRSGYASDGVTTQIGFFTGTGAADISVNASLTADTTRALLAASSRMGVTTNGEIAQFLGNIPNLLANNFIQSRPAVGPAINPNLAVFTQPFATIPSAAGSFTVNGVLVNWTNANSVYEILDLINAADPNVQAVFNVTERRFYMYSNNPINFVDTAGNFTQFGTLNNVLTSTIRMNNGFAPSDPRINILDFGTPLADDLNSQFPGTFPPGNGPNSQAFRVTPGAQGAFVINGVTVQWNDTQSLSQILGSFAGPYPGTFITPFFDQVPTSPTYQMLTIFSGTAPRPITLVDLRGNFTVFTGLNGNTPVGNLTGGILNRVDNQVANQDLIVSQSRASFDQLTTAQANIGALSTVAGEPGVPIQIEQENAIKSLIAFNAALQVLGVINQMYSELVSIVGASSSSNFLQERV